MTAAYLGASEAQAAKGALQAQRIIGELQAGKLTPDVCWLQYVDLAQRHGWQSPACRAYVLEVSKRVAR